MNFDDFYQQALKIKNLPLPGADSHYKMAPEVRTQLLKSKNFKYRNPKKAGVMALFYPDLRHTTHLLLILRNAYPGVHSNQIGFPGGKMEIHDKDLLHTALREAREEVGLRPENVEVIRELTDLYIPPSNFMVTPFLALGKAPQRFVPDKTEVEALVEVPLDEYLNDGNLIQQKLSTSYAQNIDVPAFKLKGYVVWGATAMMLSEIRELLRQVL